MPKTLVVPVDGSSTAERALPVATVLAERFGVCDIVVVAADAQAADRHRSYLESLVERTPRPITLRAECHAGDPAGVIARIAAQEPDAAVCMTTHGRGRVVAPLIGSVATEVLRLVAAPMVLVGPNCRDDWWHEPPRMVACWAGSDSNAILAPAVTWSDALAMDLSLVCDFHPLDVPATVNPQAEFASALAQLDRKHRGIPTVALHQEVPALAITAYTHDLPASLVALTTRARSGMSRAVLGSVALDIVHHSTCPVLAVRKP
jgi:nucleotide-binding universal stress UspA family protein